MWFSHPQSSGEVTLLPECHWHDPLCWKITLDMVCNLSLPLSCWHDSGNTGWWIGRWIEFWEYALQCYSPSVGEEEEGGFLQLTDQPVHLDQQALGSVRDHATKISVETPLCVNQPLSYTLTHTYMYMHLHTQVPRWTHRTLLKLHSW